jgi:hypothetical protein
MSVRGPTGCLPSNGDLDREAASRITGQARLQGRGPRRPYPRIGTKERRARAEWGRPFPGLEVLETRREVSRRLCDLWLVVHRRA